MSFINAPLISVILPVYNVERYLDECLHSIIQQTYQNIEIILVIDGATDNSYTIAKKFQREDRRIRIINQENKGSGPARNNGLDNARGDFVVFVDPDDWVAKDYVEKLYEGYENTRVDMVLSNKCDCLCDKEGNVVRKVKHEIEYTVISSQLEVRQQYLTISAKNLVSAPTRILYKLDIIKQNQIEFPDLRRSQDIVFNYRYYNCISSLAMINYCGYMYRIESSSYALRLKPDYYKTIILIFNDIEKLHASWRVPFNKTLASTIYANVVNAYVESMFLRGKDYAFIFNISEIIDIEKNSSPSGLYKNIMKFLIIHKMTKTISLTISTKRFIKNIFNL